MMMMMTVAAMIVTETQKDRGNFYRLLLSLMTGTSLHVPIERTIRVNIAVVTSNGGHVR